MSRSYEAAVTKTTGAAAGIIACFVEPASGRRATVMELGVFATTAVAGEVALGLPGNTPAGTLTGTTVTPNDPSDETGLGVLVTAFGTTAPTAPGSNRRRIQLPAVIGAGIVWTWNEGELIIPVNTFNQGLLVWQLSAAAVTYDVYIKVKE